MIQYLKRFFDEKQLPFAQWELEDNTGMTHIISNEVVIEAIGNASNGEQQAIASMIRKLDYHDADVNDYLKHLAGALING